MQLLLLGQKLDFHHLTSPYVYGVVLKQVMKNLKVLE